MYYYHAFGLNIKSALLLPELLPLSLSPKNNALDVVIELGDVSETGLVDAAERGAFYQAADNAFWLHVPEVAYYLVRDGKHITIAPMSHASVDSLRVFLLGSCMGALLMQRDLFLLHGNALKVGQHSVSFLGQSGAGKSTLTGAFMQRGYLVLADDVCAINQSQAVIPSFPHIKLWADASQKLSIETKTLRKIRPNLNKFSVPLDSCFYAEPLPLKVVYILRIYNQAGFELKSLNGMQKILPLKNNTYRYQYLKGLGKTQLHLKHTGALASNIQVVRISRPESGFQLDELVNLIESDLSARGLTCA